MLGKTKAPVESGDHLAWQDGYDSRHEGKAIGINRFRPGSKQHTEWEAGYLHADQEIANVEQ